MLFDKIVTFLEGNKYNMAANIFEVSNPQAANSLDEFYALKDRNNNKFKSIVYYKDDLISTKDDKITFTNEVFEEVSFSKTTIKNIKFFNCTFDKCLFLSTIFEDCTFSNCTFSSCNTLGSEWKGKTSIDPKVFSENFDYVHDSNIATKLFVELMGLYEENHQIDRHKDARYLYLKSTNSLIHYHYNITKDIGVITFYKKRFSSWFLDKLSGYGVYKGRLLSFLSIFLVTISFFNYFFQDIMFKIKDDAPQTILSDPTFSDFFFNLLNFNNDIVQYNLLDLAYFSFITITTIGYGDIAPTTSLGQLIIMIESAIGILLIALSLNMFTNGK